VPALLRRVLFVLLLLRAYHAGRERDHRPLDQSYRASAHAGDHGCAPAGGGGVPDRDGTGVRDVEGVRVLPPPELGGLRDEQVKRLVGLASTDALVVLGYAVGAPANGAHPT
jgi:hypothetical protein